jgi:MATE family multidrug resistance protein
MRAESACYSGRFVFAARSLTARLIALSAPVALARLGIMGMGIADVMAVGQLAPRELPHQALGWAPTGVMVVTGMGLLTGVQVLAARAIGGGNPAHAGTALRRGLVVALAAGGVSALMMWSLGARLFTAFGIAPELALPAAKVMNVLALSVPMSLVYTATASFLEAIQRPLPSTWVMWIGNLVNLALLLWLVPQHGALGSAYATLGARGFLALALLAYVLFMPDAAHYGVRTRGVAPSYGALFRVGTAAALSQAAEAGAFSGMTLLAGRLGEQAVATYQIELNALAVVFMVSLGLATGTSVLTAEAVGSADFRNAARASYQGLALNTLLMLLIGGALIALRTAIAHAYTADVAIAAACASFFPLLALIVLPDGGQVVCAAALRARGDNWFPTGSHLFAYALVMPVLAFLWAEHEAQGVAGLMWAILAASALSASVLFLRVLVLTRRASQRAANAQAL